MVTVDAHPSETSATAAKLLAAAQDLGLPAAVVATTSDGLFGYGFVVPDEVARAAGFKVGEDEVAAPEPEGEAEPEVPVKRGPGRPKKAVE